MFTRGYRSNFILSVTPRVDLNLNLKCLCCKHVVNFTAFFLRIFQEDESVPTSYKSLRHLQIVAQWTSSLAGLLLLADLDCTAFAYDGAEVYGLQRSVDAAILKLNFIPGLMLVHHSDTPARIARYVVRGYGCVVSADAKFVEGASAAWQRVQNQMKNEVELLGREFLSLHIMWGDTQQQRWDLACNYFKE